MKSTALWNATLYRLVKYSKQRAESNFRVEEDTGGTFPLNGL
jgi:hypothetical protein